MLEIDVLIVGGGPSGSTLGYILQKSDIKCCIIDRSFFPREKLCGGLVTYKTRELIVKIFGNAEFPMERSSNKISFFLDTEKISEVEVEKSLYFVERKAFDAYFIERFIEEKGILFENTVIREIDFEENIITTMLGVKIKYKILVGADGANSQIRSTIDKNYRPNALCLEYNHPSSIVTDEVQVYFSVIQDGYGWCFPKQNHYTIGIGGKIKKNKKIKESFHRFCKSIGKIEGYNTTKGALIPFGKYVRKPCLKNILLVGDAAGLVDPITGEGLYFSFLSSNFAAEAIRNHLQNGEQLEKSYYKKVKNIHKIIDNAKVFNCFVFNKFLKKFLLPLLRGRKRIIKYYAENLLSQYNISYVSFIPKYLKVRLYKKGSL